VHEIRNFEILAFVAVDAINSRSNVFVKGRHRAVEHVGHEEQDVLKLVGNGHLFGGMLGGLPARRREHSNILQSGRCFLGCHRRVKQIDEVSDDVLFFAKNRTACRFSRVRSEHGFDRH